MANNNNQPSGPPAPAPPPQTQGSTGQQSQQSMPARGNVRVAPKTEGQESPVPTVGTGASDIRQASIAGTPQVSGTEQLVEGQTRGMESAPGTSTQTNQVKTGFSIQGLGDITDVEDEKTLESEGEGDKVVVLFDMVSGVEGPVLKGKVVRISKLIRGWNDKDKSNAKREASRLFTMNAIRLAAPEERDLDQIEIRPEGETQIVSEERAKRIAAEQRAEELERQIVIMKQDAEQRQSLNKEPNK